MQARHGKTVLYDVVRTGALLCASYSSAEAQKQASPGAEAQDCRKVRADRGQVGKACQGRQEQLLEFTIILAGLATVLQVVEDLEEADTSSFGFVQLAPNSAGLKGFEHV